MLPSAIESDMHRYQQQHLHKCDERFIENKRQQPSESPPIVSNQISCNAPPSSIKQFQHLPHGTYQQQPRQILLPPRQNLLYQQNAIVTPNEATPNNHLQAQTKMLISSRQISPDLGCIPQQNEQIHISECLKGIGNQQHHMQNGFQYVTTKIEPKQDQRVMSAENVHYSAIRNKLLIPPITPAMPTTIINSGSVPITAGKKRDIVSSLSLLNTEPPPVRYSVEMVSRLCDSEMNGDTDEELKICRDYAPPDDNSVTCFNNTTIAQQTQQKIIKLRRKRQKVRICGKFRSVNSAVDEMCKVVEAYDFDQTDLFPLGNHSTLILNIPLLSYKT